MKAIGKVLFQTLTSLALFAPVTLLAGPVEDGGTLACSDDVGLATINDIRFPGTGVGNNDYLEVYIVGNDVDVSGWQLCHTYSSGESCVELGDGNLNEYYYGNPQGDDASPGSFNTGTYLEFEVPNNQSLNPDDGEVLLVNNINGVDVVVDYIQYCQAATCPAGYWDVPAECGFTLAGHDAGNKDIARLPDGTGDFGDNGDEVTRGDTNDDSAPTPLFGFTFDNDLTTGSQGNAVGSAVGDSTISGANPAVVGSPGTCNYAVFDGSDDYVAVNALPSGGGDDDDEIELENPSLTFTAWIQTSSDSSTQTIFSFADGGDYLRLSVTPTGKLEYTSSMTNPGSLSTANGVIQNDIWYFIALVIDPSNNEIQIYRATQTGAITLVASDGFTVPDEFELEIEDGNEFTIGGGPGISSFNGFIDEAALFGGPLSDSSLGTIKNVTRPCPVSFDHYAISHPGTGVTCAATPITFTGHNNADAATAPPAGTTITVSIDGNTAGLGSWTLNTGTPASFTALANGEATYVFDGSETSVVLDLLYPQQATINLNVSDGVASEPLPQGGAEDPDLVISRAGFIWSTINTQISGKPSNMQPGAQIPANGNAITIQAVRAADNNPAVCLPGFPANETRSIEFGAECLNPSTCAGQQLSITNNGATTAVATSDDNTSASNPTGDATAAYTPVDILFGANATAELVINYADAGLMQLHAKYNNPGNDPADILNGTYQASNAFVVRPFAFRMSVAGNPGEAGITEGSNIFRDAGEVFNIRLDAVNWQQADDNSTVDGVPDNYNYTDPAQFQDLLADNAITPNFGNETMSATAALAASLVAPVGGDNGSFSNPVATFSSGVSDTATGWLEVGSMNTLATTTNYLGGGQNISGQSAIIGRFHPARYAITNAIVTPAISATTCGVSQTVSYTYSRQPFDVLLAVEAQSTTGTVTQNYRDSHVTLDITDTDELSVRNNATGTAYDTHNASYVPGSSFSDVNAGTTGTAMVNLQLAWNMPVQLPTTSTVTISSPSADEQAGGVSTAPVTFAGSGVDLNDLGSTEVRYGRLQLSNAFGSELVPLAIPLQVQSYQTDGLSSYFGVASDDNCSTYNSADMTVNADIVLTDNLDNGESVPSGTGITTSGLPDNANPLILSPPGAGNDGAALLTLDVPAWLEFDWDGAPGDEDPTATATFGIYGGSDNTIFIREVTN